MQVISHHVISNGEAGEIFPLPEPEFQDISPSFDMTK
jgi:hypothetical protein